MRSYGGRTAEERTASRRAQLLEATIAVVAREGEAGTTMTAICAETRLTERYFYESFNSREDAVLTALDSVCEEIAALTRRAIAETSGEPGARVEAALSAFVDLVVREPAKAVIAVVESNATARLRVRRRELLTMFADLVAGEAAVLYGEEAWPAERARLHGLVYIAGFTELVASWLTGEIALSPEELIRTATDLFASIARRL